MRIHALLLAVAPSCGAMLDAAEHRLTPGELATLPTLSPGDVVELAAGTYHDVRRLSAAARASARS